MTSATFESILNKPARDVQPPKPIPVGTYLAVVEPNFEIKQMGKENTDVIEHTLKFLVARDDVDPQALQEFGPIQGVTRRHRLWVTEDSEWRLKQFYVDVLGLDDDKSIRQLIADAAGHQLLVSVGHRPAQDGSRLYDEIKSTARAV